MYRNKSEPVNPNNYENGDEKSKTREWGLQAMRALLPDSTKVMQGEASICLPQHTYVR